MPGCGTVEARHGLRFRPRVAYRPKFGGRRGPTQGGSRFHSTDVILARYSGFPQEILAAERSASSSRRTATAC